MTDRFEWPTTAVPEALRNAQAAASPSEFVDPITLLRHHEPCALGDVDTVCGCPPGWPKAATR